MKTLKRILLFMAGVFLLVACLEPEGFFLNNSGESGLNKGKIAPVSKTYKAGDIVMLSGVAPYLTWEVIGGKVVQDVSNPCVADLEFLGDHNFRFTFTEYKPAYAITVECYGKMAESGEFSFKYPVPVMVLPDGTGLNITDIIKGHACATIWGEGINDGTLVFKGNFDGKKFTATAYFMAKVASPCPSNDMFDPELVNGNLHWTFGYDLDVLK